ncbi:MAG: TauD/TfdA family dioxygenase [Bdellovibrionota bacterium]
MLTLSSDGFTLLKEARLHEDELLNVASALGPLLHWDFGPVMTMRFQKDAANYLFSDEAVPFHWDGAFYKEPMFLLFHCLESEGNGGETTFVDTTRLWNSLSSEEQNECLGVTLTYSTEKKAHYGGTITVPLVQKHPLTGETILRLAEKVETEKNPVTLKIDGASPDFYERMTSKLYDNMITHSWEKGDLLIVDNFRYLHGRKALAGNMTRSFKRIQILQETV